MNRTARGRGGCALAQRSSNKKKRNVCGQANVIHEKSDHIYKKIKQSTPRSVPCYLLESFSSINFMCQIDSVLAGHATGRSRS